MISRSLSFAVLVVSLGGAFEATRAAEGDATGAKAALIEQLPTGTAGAKVVLIAGSSKYKPGEHEYVAGCAVLMDLLKQSPDVSPVLAIDWPKNPETLAGARAVVLLLDGGDKHALIDPARMAQVEALAAKGAGIVQLHQIADYPTALGDRARQLAGAAWEKGFSQRAHWVATFREFPNHPVFRGVTPFTIDDGWLTNLRFVADRKGVTPLLRTVSPKDTKTKISDDGAIISWAYDRPDGGRSFTFTGGHLHKSLADEGYRRFLVNGILWSAGVDVPSSGAPVALDNAALNDALKITTSAKAK